MGRDKRWSSNDKNQLLVENFRKFMEEGDFSPEPEVNEGETGDVEVATDLEDAAEQIITSLKKASLDTDAILVLDPQYGGGAKIPLSNLNVTTLANAMQKYADDVDDMKPDGKIAVDDQGNPVKDQAGRNMSSGNMIHDPSALLFNKKNNMAFWQVFDDRGKVGYIGPKGEFVSQRQR